MPGFVEIIRENIQHRGSEDSLYLLFSGNKLLCSDQGSVLVHKHGSLGLHSELVDTAVYVGQWSGMPLFTARVVNGNDAGPELPLRELAAQDEALFAVAGRALQLLRWRDDHCFCGRCGSLNTAHATETAMQCTNCGLSYYPRLMPCVMALIVEGDRCLLAQHSARSQWWTALAGFVEAGENAEQCLAREIAEEVGLQATSWRYSHSQAWPFPGQLMLGFFVECQPADLILDAEEIAAARWFERDRLPDIPPAYTISGQLIREFVARGKSVLKN